MPVIFQDFSVKVKGALSSAVDQYLEEASAEIESAARRKSRVDSGQLKGSWDHRVSSAKQEATVGSPLENAVWEEFGTGEYAEKGDGRKGGWYVPAEKLSAKAKRKMRKTKIKGKVFYFTRGKKPNRTLHTAYENNKAKIIRRAEKIFGERMK